MFIAAIVFIGGPALTAEAPLDNEPAAVVEDVLAPVAAEADEAATPVQQGTGDTATDGSSTVDIQPQEVPMASMPARGGWGLLDLILALAAMLGAAVQLAAGLRGRRGDKGAPGRGLGSVPYVAAIVSGVMPLCLFLLLEDRHRMLYMSKWTPIIALLFLLHLIAFILALVHARQDGTGQPGE